jgi:hypothetical protein
MTQKSNTIGAKESRQLLRELMLNGYSHLKALNNEMQALKITDPATAPEEDQRKLQALMHTFVLINDLIHPAHEAAKRLLHKCDTRFIDYCMNAQRVAFESKMVETCPCSTCKTQAKEAREK